VVWESEGTTTVVFAGGGGLLLLMQPDSTAAATNSVDKIFIPVSAIIMGDRILKHGKASHTGRTPQAAMGLAPTPLSSPFLQPNSILFSHSHMSGSD
jgi:hypothetical protein